MNKEKLLDSLNMDHKDAKSIIEKMKKGEDLTLSAIERVRFDKHLEECEECSSEVANM